MVIHKVDLQQNRGHGRALGMNLCIRCCFLKLFGCFWMFLRRVYTCKSPGCCWQQMAGGLSCTWAPTPTVFRVETHLIYLNLGYRFVHDHHHLSIPLAIIHHSSSIIHHPYFIIHHPSSIIDHHRLRTCQPSTKHSSKEYRWLGR